MSRPSVAAIVINWNNYKDSQECIETLTDVDYPNLEIILVDNGSTDGSGKRLAEDFPDIHFIRVQENLGFGSANNDGIEYAKDMDIEYVWFLNNDTIIRSQGILKTLLDTFDEHNRVGVVTPVLRMHPETEKVQFTSGSVNTTTATTQHKKSIPDGEQTYLDNDYVPFCSVIMPVSIIDEVGKYPERYFMYYGDVEYCEKIKNSGYKIITNTSEEILHKVSSSTTGDLRPFYSYYISRNRILYQFSTESGRDLVFIVYSFWWVLTRFVYRVYKNQLDGGIAVVRGAYDGILGRDGTGPYG